MLTVPNEFVKFRDALLNHSGEIRPKAVEAPFRPLFSNFDKCRPDVAGDIVSGVTAGHAGVQ